MDKISIIVPIYNASKYLTKCINSILNQEYKNWELILIDDGSKDDSFLICQKFSKKDSRIISIHQTNSGANAARLKGLKSSSGKYITFLDSDDTLPSNALLLLINTISEGYDIVRGEILNVDKNETFIDEKGGKSLIHNEIIGSEKYTLALFDDTIPPYLCGALYDRKILSEEDFQITIDYNISIGEDFVTNIYISTKVNRIKFINKPVYFYYKNTDPTMNTSVMGREYCMRVDAALMPFINKASQAIQLAFTIKKAIGIISRFFIPELSYSHHEYILLQTYIKNKSISDSIYQRVNPKFLRCISWEPLYYIYTRIYCFLFKYKKLKGKVRSIKK